MLIPHGDWFHAPYLVFDARRVLASVITFSAMAHSNAYSIPSLAIDIGARVIYLDDESLEVIGACTPLKQGALITLNSAIEHTRHAMAGLVHEIGHAVIGEFACECKGRLQVESERDAWLRGIYVAISRPLAELVLNGSETAGEVAARCHVPESMVRIRTALSIVLGEHPGDERWAYESIHLNLVMLECFFEDGRARRFREWVRV